MISTLRYQIWWTTWLRYMKYHEGRVVQQCWGIVENTVLHSHALVCFTFTCVNSCFILCKRPSHPSLINKTDQPNSWTDQFNVVPVKILVNSKVWPVKPVWEHTTLFCPVTLICKSRTVSTLHRAPWDQRLMSWVLLLSLYCMCLVFSNV